MRALGSLGAGDLKRVRRDSFLVGILAIPAVTALLLRFGVPPLNVWLEASWGLELSPYYPLMVSYLVLLFTPFAMGILVGFMLLDERDERTLEALLVTPLPLRLYLGYRLAVPFLLSLVLTPLAFYGAGLTPLALGELLPVAFVVSLAAPLTAMVFPAFAENKVQGFGMQKLLNTVFVLPVAAYFIPPPWQYVAGVMFPPYWPLRALWSFVEGTPGAWLFLPLGVVTQVALLLLLMRRFDDIVYGHR